MEEWLSLLAVGSLIPAVSLAVKKLIIDNIFRNIKKEILIKGRNGKEVKFLVDQGVTKSDIKNIFEAELKFEAEVKENLKSFIDFHSEKHDIKMTEGKKLDFLLSCNGRNIGVEAKSSLNKFNKKWIGDYFKENANLDELVVVFNSKGSSGVFSDKPTQIDGKFVRYISSPKGRGLSDSITSILENDLIVEDHYFKKFNKVVIDDCFLGQGLICDDVVGKHIGNKHDRGRSRLKHG